jgi:L-lysine 6-transaminase
MLADGFDYVLDDKNSKDGYFVDARSGKKYLDFFSCFASVPIALNHPKLLQNDFATYLGSIALHKPSNSDVYSEVMATFVKTLFELCLPPDFKYSFFIEGGALANENALKTAFDWKIRQNFRKGYTYEKGTKVLHFQQAFHGRSGYTMSLTNTDPTKVKYFPKFDWPRVENPFIHFPLTEESLQHVIEAEKRSIAQIKMAFQEHTDEIAAIIIEPIQGEGGDNHFRPEFLQQLRTIADEEQALLIFDEVQTGVGITGTMWAFQQLGVVPDIVTFGKKMQVCGMAVTNRVDSEPENVFKVSSRINSTWGGNLVDMARVTRYLEIIDEDNLVNNAKVQGEELLQQLHVLQQEFPDVVSSPRGRGLYCAFTLSTPELRSKLVNKTFDNGLFVIGSGTRSMRFRPTLDITTEHITKGIDIIRTSLKEIL